MFRPFASDSEREALPTDVHGVTRANFRARRLRVDLTRSEIGWD